MDTNAEMYPVKKESLCDSAPDRLLDTCLQYIAKDLTIICKKDHLTKELSLKDDIVLPREICERLLEIYQKNVSITDYFVNIFKDKGRTKLKKVRIRNSNISDAGLNILLQHDLDELYLNFCSDLTIVSWDSIIEASNRLMILEVGNVPFKDDLFSVYMREPSFYIPLRQLTMRKQNSDSDMFFPKMPCLTHLYLSYCNSNIFSLRSLSNLVSLTLYDVYKMNLAMDSIYTLKKLQHLDISQSSDKFSIYTSPNESLSLIIDSLPDLLSLDISGTNLAGTGVADKASNDKSPQCDIPGLMKRVDNPLNFLGLYGTSHTACFRHHIPAKKISGNANEEQVLNAAVACTDKPEILTKVLNDLYHVFRFESEKRSDITRTLNIILEAMDKHTTEKHIQISGSATLFYIVKGKEQNNVIGVKLKKHIITALLNGMEGHRTDETMMRNGCLTLCQFKIPADVIFEYKRVVSVLLNGLTNVSQESFVQRIAIYLLNSLACQVDGGQKKFLGDNGAITIMLSFVSDRLARQLCDDVLEVAWSTMWNVTDETPVNCQRFLYSGGMDFFLRCLEIFPDKEELLRNMMGLLGNVAEVAELRKVFMTHKYLEVFLRLLDSASDGIEVSYNVCGILAHMASDGALAWSLVNPSRTHVLARMALAIRRWDINSKRNINYRSFEPILGLLRIYHTPECQHWAVWALANLTTVYPEKYCDLLEAEKGDALLREVLEHPAPYEHIRVLAARVLNNCFSYKLNQTVTQ